MIQIADKAKCCGCGACMQRCPKQCIEMVEDREGFLYPTIHTERCIDCGLCERVCPVIHPAAPPHEPRLVYAAKNRDEAVRLQSSSGGIFSILAEETIQAGGVVFGTIFDQDWSAKQSYTETLEGIEPMRKSKYLQSRTENSFTQTETFLKAGRQVLYVGTPCQAAALRRYLSRPYDNLLIVDFLCHGVPSPKVWQRYLQETIKSQNRDISTLSNISFRDKEVSWKQYRLKIWQKETQKTIINDHYKHNSYLRGFRKDLYLRPSCHQCPSKQGQSGSDITIADYWNINTVAPQFNDDKGVGLVLIHTENGQKRYPLERTLYLETGYKECQGRNGGFATTIAHHPMREHFFQHLDQCSDLSDLILECTLPPNKLRLTRALNWVQRVFKQQNKG